MKELKGKSALITGAASGIGKATTLAFAREGATPLILSDINGEGLAETVAEVEALGCEVMGLVADVSDPQAVKELVDAALQRCGSIYFLLNVAGTALMAPIEHQDLSDWHRVVDVNLWGSIHMVNAVYPHMVERKCGHIVNISSICGLWAYQTYIAPYLVSKFGLVGLSEGLKAEGFIHGVDVTCICPGVVRTSIWENSPVKGFRPGVRRLAKLMGLLGENPEDTARQIVQAVKKGKYLVVTTPFQRIHYVLRRHFPALFNRLSRPFFRVETAITNMYQT